MRIIRLPGITSSALAILFLVAFPFIYFFPVTLGQAVWFTRDISRVYYPFAVELSRALGEGRLPLWTPYLQAGFPLVAEGQVAAFYLPQLLLIKILPAQFVVSYEMLIHLAFAAVGMYACARLFGTSLPGALFAGFAFSFNGFMIQKLYHTPILMTAAWLPWLVFLFERWQRAQKNRDARAGVWFLLTVLAIALQWLAGSAQIALLNSVTLALFAFFGLLFWNRSADLEHLRLREILHAAFRTALPLVLGTAMAAIQLVPTAELLGYSTRARGLDDKLLTLYSYSRDSFAQFIFPFSQGEPSDDNVELWGYVGLSTLLLAISALPLRRDARTIFCFVFALAALSLTLGAENPLFQLLARLPLFNLFRVPARYVFPFAFGAILLAATAFDELAKSLPQSETRLSTPLAISFVLLIIGAIGLAYTQPLEFWLGVWNILPWLIGFVAAILIALAWRGRMARAAFRTAVIGLVVFDLSAYTATFLSTTVAQLTPPANVTQTPRSVPILGIPPSPERVLTDETIWPSVPALRASLYPNFGMLYGHEMAHAYTPLWFDANEAYFFNLTPAMLNLLNVRYFLIPLEPRFSDRRPAPYDSLALNLVDHELTISPTTVSSIQVDSFVEDTLTLAQGSTVAELNIKFDDRTSQTFPLRTGVETADWDYARQSTHALSVPSARTITGFLRSFGRNFDANMYRAQFDLSPARRVTTLGIHALGPAARITVERINLIDEKGNAMSLAALTGKDDFALRYMSDTVAIWENENVLPRAFIVHHAKITGSDQIFDNLRQPDFRPDQMVLLSDGQALDLTSSDSASDRVEITRYAPEEVSLIAESGVAGYLVLADTFYPGWTALVDGRAVPIYRADFIFRAVPLNPGKHTLVFEHRPTSFVIGAAISMASLIVTVVIAFVFGRAL